MVSSKNIDLKKHMSITSHRQWFRIIALPLILIILTYLVFGFYYETNDDAVLKLILQGKSVDLGASSLRIYMPGWAYILKILYAYMPGFPWYDMLMVIVMYIAIMTIFYVLELSMSCSNQSGLVIMLIEVIYFGTTYPLHLLQMNFTRPAIIAGAASAALLVLPYKKGYSTVKHWVAAGLLFITGWSIRPIGADVGALVVLVVALFWLTPKRMVYAGAYVGILIALLTLLNIASQNTDDKRFLSIQARRAELLDYERVKIVPITTADSVAADILNWQAGPYDIELINDSFFQRCLIPLSLAEKKQLWIATLKLIQRDVRQWAFGTLGLVVLAGLLVAWHVRGRVNENRVKIFLCVVYQLFFWIVYIGVGLWFHQVPRVSQPLLSVYGLATLLSIGGAFGITIFSQIPGKSNSLIRLVCVGIAGGCIVLSVERSLRLYLTQSRQERVHEIYLRHLHAEAAGTVVVESGLNYVTANLKLFKDYHLTDYIKFITVLNWQKFDPGQARILHKLTGQPDPAEALLKLGYMPASKVKWILMPENVRSLTRYLNVQLRRTGGDSVYFVKLPGQLAAGVGPQFYRFEDKTRSDL